MTKEELIDRIEAIANEALKEGHNPTASVLFALCGCIVASTDIDLAIAVRIWLLDTLKTAGKANG